MPHLDTDEQYEFINLQSLFIDTLRIWQTTAAFYRKKFLFVPKKASVVAKTSTNQ